MGKGEGTHQRTAIEIAADDTPMVPFSYPTELEFPERSLILIGGPAGIGKSTALKRWGIEPWMVVSSDHCRYLLSGAEDNQNINASAFRLVHVIAEEKLRHGFPVFIDSLALSSFSRQSLIRIAARQGATAHLVVLDGNYELCKARQELRERKVPDEAIERQIRELNRLKRRFLNGKLPAEGLASTIFLNQDGAKNIKTISFRPLAAQTFPC